MAAKERSYRVLLYALALFGLTLDQATKYSVFSWLRPEPGRLEGRTFPIFHTDNGGFQLVAQFELNDEHTDLMRNADGSLVPHVNHGALFGFLRDHKSAANAAFAFVSLAAALFIIFISVYYRSTAQDRMQCIALGLILAGTLGNFYDRVVFDGVRDFLHWDYFYNWPVFNIADCCLVCGAGFLLLQAFLHPARPAQPQPLEAPTAKAS
jgi:lipoprotein signal peptidase